MKTKLLGGWMVAVAVLAPASIAVAQPGSGDLWETSMQMQMMGMSMPAVKEKVCSPKEWKEPPGLPKDNKCETLESTQLPDGYRFKVRCKGQMPMTGSGEFKNLGKDAYDGMMIMTSEMGEMTMKMSGRKVGECDAGEMQRKVAKLQKDADRAIADGARQMCEMGLESMQPTLFGVTVEGPRRGADMAIPQGLERFIHQVYYGKRYFHFVAETAGRLTSIGQVEPALRWLPMATWWRKQDFVVGDTTYRIWSPPIEIPNPFPIPQDQALFGHAVQAPTAPGAWKARWPPCRCRTRWKA